jgi:hypothetical protein
MKKPVSFGGFNGDAPQNKKKEGVSNPASKVKATLNQKCCFQLKELITLPQPAWPSRKKVNNIPAVLILVSYVSMLVC